MIGFEAFSARRKRAEIWTQRTSSFSDDWVDWVYYGDGYWVACANNGKIATATDPTGTWTQRTSGFDGGDTIRGGLYYDGLYINVGNASKLFTATDPTSTWTSRTSNMGDNIYSIATDGTTYVIVGPRSCYSTNPTGTWTVGPAIGSNQTSVAFGNGVWVSVGESAGQRLYTSSDPTSSWADWDDPLDLDVPVYSVAYGNGIWVCAGGSGALSTATDPTGTWTSRTSSFGSDTIYEVVYGGGMWVAVSGSGKIATATDPTGTWTQQTSSFSTTDIYGIAFDGTGKWVATASEGKLATSPG